ncbi:unnamed protein product [Boreogadus saida]
MSVSAEESAVKVCVRVRPLIERSGGSDSHSESIKSQHHKSTIYRGPRQSLVVCPPSRDTMSVSYAETSRYETQHLRPLMGTSWFQVVIPLDPLEESSHTHSNIYVADLTEELVTCPAHALSWVFKGEKPALWEDQMTQAGAVDSHTISECLRDNSEGAIIVSHLNLVDLAGQNGPAKPGRKALALRKAAHINRSLFTLAQVIKSCLTRARGLHQLPRQQADPHPAETPWGATPRRSSSAPSPWPPWRRPSAPCR